MIKNCATSDGYSVVKYQKILSLIRNVCSSSNIKNLIARKDLHGNIILSRGKAFFITYSIWRKTVTPAPNLIWETAIPEVGAYHSIVMERIIHCQIKIVVIMDYYAILIDKNKPY